MKSSCDNCKYLDDCPEEYHQEQPNWCENWEPVPQVMKDPADKNSSGHDPARRLV